MIKLNNVSKIYTLNKSTEVKALESVSLEIARGSNVAIVGVSGSGKSTLLNIIGCLDVATSGEYYLDGVQTQDMSANELANIRNAKIGFILQDNALLNNESVYSNVRLPLVFSKKYKIKEHKKRVKDVLSMLNISELYKRKIRELSGGQRQRVAVARALVNDPEIILADEPTSALDSKTAYQILDVFKDLSSKGITIIIVTHDNKVVSYAQDVITIVDGKISESDVKKE